MLTTWNYRSKIKRLGMCAGFGKPGSLEKNTNQSKKKQSEYRFNVPGVFFVFLYRFQLCKMKTIWYKYAAGWLIEGHFSWTLHRQVTTASPLDWCEKLFRSMTDQCNELAATVRFLSSVPPHRPLYNSPVRRKCVWFHSITHFLLEKNNQNINMLIIAYSAHWTPSFGSGIYSLYLRFPPGHYLATVME